MSDSQENSLLKSTVQGAIAGLSAGLVYGIVEFALAVAVPRLWSNESELLPWQWPLIGMLVGVYAVAGLLCGAAGGAWLARGRSVPDPEYHKALACLVLSVAFALNLMGAWPLARREAVALALAAALAVVFWAALISEAWQRRTAFLASPVMLSLLLLIGPWVSGEELSGHSPWVKTVGSLLAVAGVLVAAGISYRIFRRKPARRITKVAAGTVAVVLLGAATLAPGTTILGKAVNAALPSASGKPNILLITLDTVRADHVSAYGYERDTTPSLREFAREATLYERTVACDGFTLPTHASMFTGLYPSWHGATRRPNRSSGAPLAPNTRTLASLLRANGYWTAETAANYGYLGNWTGLTQGFASSEVIRAMRLSDSDRPFYLRQGARKLLSAAIRTDDFDEYCLRAPDVNRHAFALLEQARNRPAPFFLFLNYMDAHSPYLPPPPFREQFAAGKGDLKPISADAFLAVRDAVNAGKRSLDEREKRYLVSQYDAGIACIDFHIGRLLDRLRELGLYENTLVIVTADHGEAFGEHNRMEHAYGSLYQDQIHVPLLIKYPGQHEGQRSHALVSQVDFLPTILDLAGIAAPAGAQGQSLRLPRAEDSGAVFAESGPRSDERANPRLRGVRRTVFSGPWKLIAWTDGPPELYNLAADPGELHNLYRAGDHEAAALLARINQFTAAAPRRSSPSDKPVDRPTLEKLRSLGYIQ